MVSNMFLTKKNHNIMKVVRAEAKDLEVAKHRESKAAAEVEVVNMELPRAPITMEAISSTNLTIVQEQEGVKASTNATTTTRSLIMRQGPKKVTTNLRDSLPMLKRNRAPVEIQVITRTRHTRTNTTMRFRKAAPINSVEDTRRRKVPSAKQLLVTHNTKKAVRLTARKVVTTLKGTLTDLRVVLKPEINNLRERK